MPHGASPDRRNPQPWGSGTRRGRRSRAPEALTVAVVLVASATWAHAVDLRLATENDFLTRNPTADDLYTFSIALEVEHGPYSISLRENAFTDRDAGVRFDETYLTVGRDVPGLRSWRVHAEVGLAHVGQGLFGQDAQNAFHRIIGDEEVDLAYADSSLHASLALTAERSFGPVEHLEVGPRLEATSVPGLRSHGVLGAEARWQPKPGIAIEVFAGGRLSHASLGALEPHLAELGAVVRVGILLNDAVFLSWTYNDYGDKREHLSLGYRIPLGGRGRAMHDGKLKARAGD